MLRGVRFVSGYFRPSARLEEREVEVPTAGSAVPATLIRPATPRPLPGFVVLHGITVPGRKHTVLQRFARALASTGRSVLLPEIREWCELRVAPELADATIAASARYLAAQEGTRPGGVGVVGFSFGATQALITAARTDLDAPIRSVVSFGGYCDLRRTLLFMMTGEHEWDGVRFRFEPDPYGRWIAAGNYLLGVPGMQDMQPVASGALELATQAGRDGAYAGEARYDGLKAQIRRGLDARQREIWDLVAPPAGTRLPLEPAQRLAEQLAESALRLEPGLDPRPTLPHLHRPVVLAHGHQDTLVPWTETPRVLALLPPKARATATVTRLFAHSRGGDPLAAWRYPGEVLRYLRLLDRALA